MTPSTVYSRFTSELHKLESQLQDKDSEIFLLRQQLGSFGYESTVERADADVEVDVDAGSIDEVDDNFIFGLMEFVKEEIDLDAGN